MSRIKAIWRCGRIVADEAKSELILAEKLLEAAILVGSGFWLVGMREINWAIFSSWAVVSSAGSVDSKSTSSVGKAS